jgi:hypothetical protein
MYDLCDLECDLGLPGPHNQGLAQHNNTSLVAAAAA